jgi:hypothetical protein
MGIGVKFSRHMAETLSLAKLSGCSGAALRAPWRARCARRRVAQGAPPPGRGDVSI